MVANAQSAAKPATKITIGAGTAKNVLDAAQLGRMVTSGMAANVQDAARGMTRGMIGVRTARDAPDVARKKSQSN